MMYAVFGYDANEFEETKHPRDEAGKFTSGGQTHTVHPDLHEHLTKGEFKQLPGSGTYAHHSGAKVEVQPSYLKAKEGIPTHHWKSLKHGFPVGEGYFSKPDLESLKTHPAEKAANHKDFILKAAEKHPSLGNNEIAELVNKEFGKTMTGNAVSQVKTVAKHPEKYGAGATTKPKAEASSQPVKEPEPVPKHIGPAYALLDPKGYKIDTSLSDPKNLVVTKPNGASVKLNATTGDWEASTPGHMTKAGNGVEALELLLSGNHPGSNPPWKNVSGSTASVVASPPPPPPPSQEHKKVLNTIAAARPKPTEAEAKALSHYKGSGYKDMNEALRNDYEAFHSQYIKSIDAFLERSSIPEDVTLYRQLQYHSEYNKILRSILHDGASFMDRGFISTTTNPKLEFGGGLSFTIKVPKGAHGAAIRAQGLNDSESEVLLPRDTVFKVTSFDRKAGHASV